MQCPSALISAMACPNGCSRERRIFSSSSRSDGPALAFSSSMRASRSRSSASFLSLRFIALVIPPCPAAAPGSSASATVAFAETSFASASAAWASSSDDASPPSSPPSLASSHARVSSYCLWLIHPIILTLLSFSGLDWPSDAHSASTAARSRR